MRKFLQGVGVACFMPKAPWSSKKASSVGMRIAGTEVTAIAESYSHLSGVVSEVKNERQ